MKFALLVVLVAALALAEAKPRRIHKKTGVRNVRKLSFKDGVDCIDFSVATPEDLKVYTVPIDADRNPILDVTALGAPAIVQYCKPEASPGAVTLTDLETIPITGTQFVVVLNDNGVWELKYVPPKPESIVPQSGESESVRYVMSDGILYPEGSLSSDKVITRLYKLIDGIFYPLDSTPSLSGEWLVDDASTRFIVYNGTFGPELMLREKAPTPKPVDGVVTTSGEVQLAPVYEVRGSEKYGNVLFRNQQSGIPEVDLSNTWPLSGGVVSTDGELEVANWNQKFEVLPDPVTGHDVLVVKGSSKSLRSIKARKLSNKRQRKQRTNKKVRRVL